MANITVFCAGAAGNHPAHQEAAKRLGTSIATRGHTLVYGGASGGLMGILAESALAAGGRVIGILPQVLEKREIGHPRLSELRIVASMAERKNMLLDLADAVVALPGGLGTLDELFEAATWAQIGLKTFPIGAVNIDGYYDHLFAFLDRAAQDGLLQLPYRGLVRSASTPEAVLDLLGM
ncbi:MAG: TIGR00730 family Rossman fold protein [Polyangiaceae bacterium]